MVTLDFKLKTTEERKKYIEDLLSTQSDWSSRDLEKMSDYLVFSMEKEERLQHYINDPNRRVTHRKRETSFQGLAEKFENGEDGVYAMVHEDRHQLLDNHSPITD